MPRGPPPKVVRVAEKYDLPDLGEHLEHRWTDPDHGASLRELTREVNIRILRRAIENAGQQPLDGEVENLYSLVTDDDVSQGARTEARDRLHHLGIDVDELTTDFLSRQALHNYLTTHRDASPPDSQHSDEDDDVRQTRLESIQRLRSRLETVTRSILDELSDTGHLTLGDPSIHVTVRVHCDECGTHDSIDNVLQNHGCECRPNPD